MIQTVYALLAIMLIGLVTLSFSRGIHSNEQEMMLNELASEMTSVGSEILNEVGRYPYDPVALVVTTDHVLNTRGALRLESTFGTGSTCNPNTQYSGCLFINDFHGKTATRVRQRIYNGVTHDITYTVESIVVRYVSESTPHTPTGTKTFAKEVVVTVSCPLVYLGSPDTPLKVQMSRVYTYPNI